MLCWTHAQCRRMRILIRVFILMCARYWTPIIILVHWLRIKTMARARHALCLSLFSPLQWIWSSNERRRPKKITSQKRMAQDSLDPWPHKLQARVRLYNISKTLSLCFSTREKEWWWLKTLYPRFASYCEFKRCIFTVPVGGSLCSPSSSSP